MPIQCICKNCGASFFASHSRIKSGRGRFCSVPCYRAVPLGIPQPNRTVLVPLSDGRFAIIDEADADRVLAHRWFVTIHGYAARTLSRDEGQKRLYLHRVVMDAQPGDEIDHRNRDRLDCRRENLRAVTHQQNLMNAGLSKASTSGYRGVSWDKSRGLWSAKITHHYRTINIGRFRTAVEAARAYDATALALSGSVAHLNFPDE